MFYQYVNDLYIFPEFPNFYLTLHKENLIRFIIFCTLYTLVGPTNFEMFQRKHHQSDQGHGLLDRFLRVLLRLESLRFSQRAYPETLYSSAAVKSNQHIFFRGHKSTKKEFG